MAESFDWLDDFGTRSAGTQLPIPMTIEDTVLLWLHELKDTHLKEKLAAKEVVGGGGQESKLAGSGNISELIITDGKLKWVLLMSDYWKYVEYGRGPTKSGGNGAVFRNIHDHWLPWKGWNFNSKLREWGFLKSGNPDLPYEKSLTTLSDIIARSIHKKGTIQRFNYKGTDFVKETLKEQLPELSKQLAKNLGRKVEVTLAGTLIKELKQ